MTTTTEQKQTEPSSVKSMDEIVALCRRRGFIFQSSEIYGGINGFWDYGPLGTLLKRNLKDAWWQDMVQQELIGPGGQPIDIVALDSTIIMNPEVWVASGHLAGFNDPMQTCKQCKKLFRADHVHELLEEAEWVQSFRASVLTDPTDDTLHRWIKDKKTKKIAPGLAALRERNVSMRHLAAAVLVEGPGWTTAISYLASPSGQP